MTKLEPFLTTQEPYETEDSESGDSDINKGFSSEEDDFEGLKASTKVAGNDEKVKVDKGMSPILVNSQWLKKCIAAWFKQPKGMSNWLYKYFKEEIGPILFAILLSLHSSQTTNLQPPHSGYNLQNPPFISHSIVSL